MAFQKSVEAQILLIASLSLALLIFVSLIICAAQLIAPKNSIQRRLSSGLLLLQIFCILGIIEFDENNMFSGNSLLFGTPLIILVLISHFALLRNLATKTDAHEEEWPRQLEKKGEHP